MARKRGSTWQADVGLPNGKRLRPGGFASQAEAELWEAQAKVAATKGTALPPLPVPSRTGADLTGATLGDLRRLLLTTPKSKRGATGGWLGAKDYRNAEARSQMACDFFGEDKAVSSITLPELDRYARALRAAGNGPGTVNRKLACVSKMLSFAHQRGLLSAVPAIPLEEEPEGRLRWLTLAEEHQALAMLEVMGEHDLQHLVMFLLDTGCRVSEALGLQHGDLHLDGPRPQVTFSDTKNGGRRTNPLTQRAVSAVRFFTGRWEAGPFVGIDYWSARATWDRARVRLGDTFKDVVLHTFRHTCASRLVQAGVDIVRVQKWLGHKDVKTTMIYAKLAPGDLDVAASVLEPGATNVVPLRRQA
jgi:integrase